MNKLLALATVFLLLAPTPRPAQDSPAAVVVKLDGSVQIQAGDAAPQPATVGTRLFTGDRVIPGENGRAVLVFSSGATRTVTEATTIETPRGGQEGDMFSRAVQVLSQAANSDVRNQPNRQGMIRPIPGAPEIVSPRNGIPVQSTRPTFVWVPALDRESGEYMIQIRREGEAPVRYDVGNTTSWTLPPDAPALTPGATYWWTVGRKQRGRPSREMTFQVLSVEKHDALNEQMATLINAGLDPEGDGAFMAAVIYREAGLYYDAAHSLEFLEEIGQPLGVNAFLLKGEIMDALGDLEAAREAFDQADRMGQ
jgi:hypothetical protein